MASLTQHDLSILEKIKDPEAGPSAPLLLSADLPRDPHIQDELIYQAITQSERSIISSIQQTELQIAGLKPQVQDARSPLDQYLDSVQRLDKLIDEYPRYGSIRNNRAQALRRIYGDGILVKRAGCKEAQSKEAPPPPPPPSPQQQQQPLDASASDSTLVSVSFKILSDLSTCITLLSPPTPYSPISPQAAKTLSQAYTQRGAIYHLTAKYLSTQGSQLRIGNEREEKTWKTVEWEETASRDFAMGGRYGNEVAKALAVSVNPTAKLCGEMVKEAMRKEYAGGIA